MPFDARTRFTPFKATVSWLFVLLNLMAFQVSANEQDEAALQVKAQFIYNFANFVEWPNDAFSNSETPIKVCLFGEVAFAPYLYTFDGAMIGERELIVTRADQIVQVREGCHILYVGNDKRVKLPNFWKQIQYVYVLSIGSRDGFADKGGVVNILRSNDKLQFDVNIENALSNGLFLDSDLLALARIIKRNTQIKKPASEPGEQS